MRLFALALEQGAIFGDRATWMDAQTTLPIELAITFQANQAFIAQLVTSLQKLRGAVPSISNNDDLEVSKEWFECSQLLNGYFDRSLLDWDTLDIQGRDPATCDLGQEDHFRRLPTDTQGFIY